MKGYFSKQWSILGNLDMHHTTAIDVNKGSSRIRSILRGLFDFRFGSHATLNSTQRTTKRLRLSRRRKLPKSVIITLICIFLYLRIVTYACARSIDYLLGLHPLGVAGYAVSKIRFQPLNVTGQGNLGSRLFSHPIYSKEVLQYEPGIAKQFRDSPPD